MQKTKKFGKTLSLLLVLLMLLAVMPITASASYALTGFGTDVDGIDISGASVQSVNLVTTPYTSGSYTNYRYTYNIILSGTTALDATVTAAFTKSGTAGAYCVISPVPPNYQPGMIDAYKTLVYDKTLSSGSGTTTTYVYHDLMNARGNTDTYIFNYTVSTINNPIQVGDIELRFGDPAYASTIPESLMSFVGSGTAYNAVYTGDDEADFYPSVLSLWASPDTEIGKLTGSGVNIATYDTLGAKTTWTTITPAQNVNNGVRSDLYTIEIGSSGGTLTVYEEDSATVAAVISFAAPKSLPAGGGATPDAVNGYLPVGQFATGAGWGGIYTAYNNVDGNAATDAAAKFTGGYVSTGASLGMLGGYVQFDMGSTPITNDADNPYGVDFIIYGNAFNGNPEAGSVQVSEDGITWYELAGSRYYDSGITRNIAKVTYIKMTAAADTGLNAAFTSAGVYVSRDYNGSNMSTATWERMGAVAWWPEQTSEGYNQSGKVFDFTGAVNTASGAPYAEWGTVTGTNTYETVTYKNVTEVPDSDTNGFYQFGYFDVTPNGTSYGNAANPYETYINGKTGGDGFDLSWAVNSSGLPVNLSSVRYVRAYSSVLHNAGIFGETSAEVCGMYVANGNTGSAASSDLEVWGATQITGINHMGAKQLPADTYEIYSDADYVYVNGTLVDVTINDGHPITLNAGDKIQIITQSGTAEAFITVLYT